MLYDPLFHFGFVLRYTTWTVYDFALTKPLDEMQRFSQCSR